MSFGFEVFDQAGLLGSSSTARLARVLATVAHGTSAPVSISLPDFNLANGFFYPIRSTAGGTGTFTGLPTITWNSSNKTLTISPNGASGTVVVGMNR